MEWTPGIRSDSRSNILLLGRQVDVQGYLLQILLHRRRRTVVAL